METLAITTLIIGASAILGFIVYSKSAKPRTSDRPDINIDFDTAKEREDKNRYFS
ncbi:hypothetical protein OAN24_00450 [Pseudodesulfovibrio sp.]|nr:hypothetical protein [Pseudodesulfovibrio sp.]